MFADDGTIIGILNETMYTRFNNIKKAGLNLSSKLKEGKPVNGFRTDSIKFIGGEFNMKEDSLKINDYTIDKVSTRVGRDLIDEINQRISSPYTKDPIYE
jgi:hypothetical protein